MSENIYGFVTVKCPRCGKEFRVLVREGDLEV